MNALFAILTVAAILMIVLASSGGKSRRRSNMPDVIGSRTDARGNTIYKIRALSGTEAASLRDGYCGSDEEIVAVGDGVYELRPVGYGQTPPRIDTTPLSGGAVDAYITRKKRERGEVLDIPQRTKVNR